MEAAPHCVAEQVRLSNDDNAEWGRRAVGKHTWRTERVSDAGEMQSQHVVRSDWTAERKDVLGGRCCGHGMRWRRMTCRHTRKVAAEPGDSSIPGFPLRTCVRCVLRDASQLFRLYFSADFRVFMCDSKQKLKHEIQSLGLALVIELYGSRVSLSWIILLTHCLNARGVLTSPATLGWSLWKRPSLLRIFYGRNGKNFSPQINYC